MFYELICLLQLNRPLIIQVLVYNEKRIVKHTPSSKKQAVYIPNKSMPSHSFWNHASCRALSKSGNEVCDLQWDTGHFPYFWERPRMSPATGIMHHWSTVGTHGLQNQPQKAWRRDHKVRHEASFLPSQNYVFTEIIVEILEKAVGL